MLPRILEPELMDTEDEARDYDAMDHSSVNRAFVSDFLARHRAGWQILDVGTGTAQIPIELCRREPRALVLAVDLAEHMLVWAARNVAAAGLVGRIHLERHDAKQLPYGDCAFGAVLSNSIVHHSPEPRRVLAELLRATARGGTLFVRDLLRPSDDTIVATIVATYAGKENEHSRAMFEASLRAALTLDEIRELVAGLGVPAESVRQTSDRHWTWVHARL